jgi:C4-dicarboxylate transporter DctQ subunit
MKSLQKTTIKVSTFFDHILNFLAILAGILLVCSTLIVGLGIFSRYFLTRPLPWVTELCEYMILYIAFLVAAWVLRQEGHVKMDIVLNKLRPKAQYVLNIITSIICAIASLILTWFGIKVTCELYATKAFTYTVLELPKFIIASVIFIGSLLLFFQFVRRTLGYVQALRRLQEQ